MFALGTVPPPARAASSATVAASLVAWINQDRTARGLVPYRMDTQLQTLATDRAARMASLGTLSHTAAGGNVGTALTNRGIQWYSYGEAIGAATGSVSTTTASYLYKLWKGSSAHWSLLMSTRYNYVGAGFAYRSSNGTTYASIVLTESLDHTRPGAKMTSYTLSGTSVTWRWAGWDGRLQTHTAGFRNFDVQYRVDSGTWRTLWSDTTNTTVTLTSRPRGHWYGIRVQGSDRRGNLSAWSSEMRVWVP